MEVVSEDAVRIGTGLRSCKDERAMSGAAKTGSTVFSLHKDRRGLELGLPSCSRRPSRTGTGKRSSLEEAAEEQPVDPVLASAAYGDVRYPCRTASTWPGKRTAMGEPSKSATAVGLMSSSLDKATHAEPKKDMHVLLRHPVSQLNGCWSWSNLEPGVCAYRNSPPPDVPTKINPSVKRVADIEREIQKLEKGFWRSCSLPSIIVGLRPACAPQTRRRRRKRRAGGDHVDASKLDFKE